MNLLIDASRLSKTFTLHQQDSLALPVLDDVSLQVAAGECVALAGPSGAGKSTLLKALYANYLVQGGSIRIRHRDAWLDMAAALPHEIADVRRHTLGYVSQFLRAIPRVAALDIVAEPLCEWGMDADAARREAGAWLARLNIRNGCGGAAGHFSGGEQQRVNIARGMIAPRPILLLDEPTASLDAANRAVVIELMREALARRGAGGHFPRRAHPRRRRRPRVRSTAGKQTGTPSMKRILNNARLILADGVVKRGALEIDNGVIAAIHAQALSAPPPHSEDLDGDDLLPGLVEVHTDNLEKHLMPRNGVLWPTLPAVVTHDAQCVAAGITTVLDALSVGDLEGDSVRLDTLQSAFDAIDAGMRQRVFRAEHLFHLRCELAYPTLLDALSPCSTTRRCAWCP